MPRTWATEDVVTLLPEDPDGSAAVLRERIYEELGVYVGVIVSDSFGRPWRWGITDVALGVAGFLPLDDLRGTPGRGRPDHAGDGRRRRRPAGLGRGAGLRQDQPPPAGLIRGARLPAGDGSVTRDVVMRRRDDLFP